MPARERGEEQERQECQDYGDDEEVGKDDGVLERRRYPYQVQRVLVDAHQVSKCRGILIAHPSSTVGSYADAKVSHSDIEIGIPNDVCDCSCDSWVDLCGAEDWWIFLVVEGDEVDVGNERRCRGAACQEECWR